MTTNPLARRRELPPVFEPIPENPARRIEAEYRQRMARTRTPREVGAVQEWERGQKLAAGLQVPPRASPLTREELDSLPEHLISLGIANGFLAWDSAGRLIETDSPPLHHVDRTA